MKEIITNIVKIADFFDNNGLAKEADELDALAQIFSGMGKNNWAKYAGTETSKKLLVKNAQSIDLALERLKHFKKVAKNKKADKKTIRLFKKASEEIVKYIFSNELYKKVKISGFWNALKEVGTGVVKNIFSPFMPAIQKARYDDISKELMQIGQSVMKQLPNLQKNPQQAKNQATNILNSLLSGFYNKMLSTASKASSDGDKLNFVISNAAVEAIRGYADRINQSDGTDIAQISANFIRTLEDIIRSASEWQQKAFGGASGGFPGGNTARPATSGPGGSGGPGGPSVAGYGGNPAMKKTPGGKIIPENIDWHKFFQRVYVKKGRLANFLKKHQGRGQRIIKEIGIPSEWADITGNIGEEELQFPKHYEGPDKQEKTEAFHRGIYGLVENLGDGAWDILGELGITPHSSYRRQGQAEGREGQEGSGAYGTPNSWDKDWKNKNIREHADDISRAVGDIANLGGRGW